MFHRWLIVTFMVFGLVMGTPLIWFATPFMIPFLFSKWTIPFAPYLGALLLAVLMTFCMWVKETYFRHGRVRTA